MNYEEAVACMDRQEMFMATVYAMNTLLIHKGIYSREEFETLVAEWATKEHRKRSHER